MFSSFPPFRSRSAEDFREAIKLANTLRCRTPQETDLHQLSSVKAVWSDCINHVPYYRTLVKRGLAPAAIESWDDFHHIPPLTRDILRDCPDQFLRQSSVPDAFRMTGGSSGTPVRFGVWNSESQSLRIVKLALWAEAGYRPSSKLFLIWGHAHLLGKGWERHFNHFVRKLKDKIIGYYRVDAYSLSAEFCEVIARKLLRYRPVGLIGYAAALDYFIRNTEKHYKEFSTLGLLFVQSAGELPPRPDTFDRLEKVFRCPVIQEYAGVDFGQVGMKNGAGPFRIINELNILEGVPRTATEEVYDLLVTTLYKRYTPLIRYSPGDAATGISWLPNGFVSSFNELEGRVHETVELSEGVFIHTMAFLHCIHQEESVLNIQLILTDGGPKLLLATSNKYNKQCEKRIRYRLGQIHQSLAGMPFDYSDEVQLTVAGKRRWIHDARRSRA